MKDPSLDPECNVLDYSCYWLIKQACDIVLLLDYLCKACHRKSSVKPAAENLLFTLVPFAWLLVRHWEYRGMKNAQNKKS